KPARRRVVHARRRFDHEHSRFPLAKSPFDFVEEQRSYTASLKCRMRCDPVQIVDAICSRRRSITHVPDQLPIARKRSDELVVRDTITRIVRSACRSRCERLIEQLERHRDFVVMKDGGRVENLANTIAMPSLEGAKLYLHQS